MMTYLISHWHEVLLSSLLVISEILGVSKSLQSKGIVDAIIKALKGKSEV